MACLICCLSQASPLMRLILITIWLAAALHAAPEFKLDSLQIGQKNYEKVTLTLEREGTVRIVHDAGVSRAAVKDLPDDVQKLLLPPPVEPMVEPISPKVAGPLADPAPISKEERYRIVEKKRVPAGGERFLVVVAKEFATQKGLELVTDEIRKTTSNQKNTLLFVFDDSRAPSMMARLDDLTEEEDRFYTKSFKATYHKSGVTGFHRASITPDGLEGPDIQIEY